jgi:hypothetical protein
MTGDRNNHVNMVWHETIYKGRNFAFIAKRFKEVHAGHGEFILDENIRAIAGTDGDMAWITILKVRIFIEPYLFHRISVGGELVSPQSE